MLELTHSSKKLGEIVIAQVVCLQVEVVRDVAKLAEGDTKSLTKPVVELVSLQDELFVSYSQQERQGDHHVPLALLYEARLCHLLANIINVIHLALKSSRAIGVLDSHLQEGVHIQLFSKND